jgi:hypothetical protein
MHLMLQHIDTRMELIAIATGASESYILQLQLAKQTKYHAGYLLHITKNHGLNTLFIIFDLTRSFNCWNPECVSFPTKIFFIPKLLTVA